VAITVRELVELPHLALDVLAGARGLEGLVRWAHVAEVADPTPWLEGGELILTTGLGLPAAPEEQAAYVERLADTKAAGLVVVADSAPPITQRLRTTADARRLPVLTTQLKQPFQAIAKIVYAANASAETKRIVDHLRIYGILRRAAAEGAGPLEVVERLAALTRTRLTVVREDGRPQFGSGEPHPRWEEAADAIARLGSARRGAYARLESDDGHAPAYVIQLDVPTRSRVFLVAEGLDDADVPDLVALHHIATITAVQVLAQRTERTLRQQLGAQLLRELVDASVPAESAHPRLASLGIESRTLAAFVVRPAESEALVLADHLFAALLDRDVTALVAAERNHLVVLAPASSETIREVGRIVAECATDTGGPCVTGAGRCAPSARLPISYREAHVACSRAAASGTALLHFEDLRNPLIWLSDDRERIRLLVERTVGPIVRYDREHGTALLVTLREYLRSGRRPAEAAAALHVHRNTLAYRLRRIENLTGRSLDTVEDQVELWLGLRAHAEELEAL
jgi:purine catabolism regulator